MPYQIVENKNGYSITDGGPIGDSYTYWWLGHDYDFGRSFDRDKNSCWVGTKRDAEVWVNKLKEGRLLNAH